MFKVRLALSVLLLSLCLPHAALSQIQEIRDYTVTRGDTLWDISGKELKDSFLWPKIWQENPEIKNPDVLYPGQKIRIPLYLMQKEKPDELAAEPAGPQEQIKAAKVEKKAAPPPGKVHPLIEKTLFMSSGYISDAIPGVGQIGGSAYIGFVFGNNDIVYVRTDNPVNAGDKFYIIRAEEVARHPLTDKKIGYIISFRGIAEITKFEYGETKARIIQMFDDITTGDLLMPYFELNPPVVPKPYRRPQIESTIVGTRDFRMVNSTLDIVYIDKGKEDGIEVGDIYRTIATGRHTIPTGFIQIIHTMEKTATAVVIESSDPILRGQLATLVE